MMSFLAHVPHLLVAVTIANSDPIPIELNDTRYMGKYKWAHAILMQPCDEKGVPTDEIKKVSVPKQAFRVIAQIGEEEDSVQQLLIKVLYYRKYREPEDADKKYGDGTNRYVKKGTLTPRNYFYKYNYEGTDKEFDELNELDKLNDDYGEDQRYFRVSSDIFLKAVPEKRIAPALATGVMTLPFRMRMGPGEDDFSGSFNFGAAIGLRFGNPVSRKFRYSILSGYSIGNVVLNKSSIGITDSTTLGLLEDVNNFTAFSFSLGFMVEYEKVQAGIFFGFDRINAETNDTFDWKYQGRPWVSAGFGLAIFSSDKNKETAKLKSKKKN